MSDKTCYLMVKDTPGGLEYGVDFDLEEGELLPADIEELTEAQYTVYKFLTVLQGTFDEDKKTATEMEAKTSPTGLLVPNKVN
jgi:hypothetical protein